MPCHSVRSYAHDLGMLKSSEVQFESAKITHVP
jgi:hypothetical protein